MHKFRFRNCRAIIAIKALQLVAAIKICQLLAAAAKII